MHLTGPIYMNTRMSMLVSSFNPSHNYSVVPKHQLCGPAMGGENRQKSGSGFEELPDPDILSGSGSKNVLERRDCLPDFLESDKINRDRSGKIEES